MSHKTNTICHTGPYHATQGDEHYTSCHTERDKRSETNQSYFKWHHPSCPNSSCPISCIIWKPMKDSEKTKQTLDRCSRQNWHLQRCTTSVYINLFFIYLCFFISCHPRSMAALLMTATKGTRSGIKQIWEEAGPLADEGSQLRACCVD